MFQKSTGLLTAAAVLFGLLLGFTIWRSTVAGQNLPLGQAPRVFQSSSNSADSSLNHTITAAGSGEVRAKPDIAFVTVGVDTQAEKADDAQQQNAARMAAVVDAIKKLGVSEADIQTSNINLQPVFDSQGRPNGGQGKIIGYRALNQVMVRVTDITKAGQVLDEAVKAGANVEGNIRFAIANDAELRQQALKKAVQDARSKADAIASALGVTISGVHSAGEGSVSVPVMKESFVPFQQSAAQASTPIQPGEMIITAQVRVVYTY